MTEFTEELERYGVRASVGYLIIDKGAGLMNHQINSAEEAVNAIMGGRFIVAERDNNGLCIEDPLDNYEGLVIYHKPDCTMVEVRPKVFIISRLDVVGWDE
mgnify:CR=1 FL=1